MNKIILSILAFFLGITAVAHSEMASSDPAAETTVTEPLKEVRLNFTEPVELDFSVFKVYELDAAGLDPESENAWQRLNGLAGALVSDVLERRDDDTARADVGLANDASRDQEIVIRLREGLSPGFYVVMWRALSIDTHATQGFFVFGFNPVAQE